MADDGKKGKLSTIVNYFQIGFFIVIGLLTATNSYMTYKQYKLVFKPVVGIVDVKTTKYLAKAKDTYENVQYVILTFTIGNVGNLPAKNCKFKVTGKIGNLNLPYTEPINPAGFILIQQAKVTSQSIIGKDILQKLVDGGEKLLLTIDASYSDWENAEYSYQVSYEVSLIQKEPLNLAVRHVS